MTKDEALKLSLEALEDVDGAEWWTRSKAITAIKQVLAAPVQEPVAWVERWYGSGPDQGWWIWERHSLTHGQAVARIGTGPFAERLTSIIVEKHNAALFPTELVKEPFAPDPHNGTGPTPPAAQRQWVGLSDLNIDELENEYMKSAQTAHQFLRAIEAKLREKNT